MRVKKLQKELYFKRKIMIHATRAERLEKNMEEKRRKEMNLVLERGWLGSLVVVRKIKFL